MTIISLVCFKQAVKQAVLPTNLVQYRHLEFGHFAVSEILGNVELKVMEGAELG